MERRAVPGKRVLMSGTIEFADSKINCIVGNMSIAGAATISGQLGVRI